MTGLLFFKCKKYPENDHVYLTAIKNRLDKHDWYFSRMLVDGNDSTLVHLSHTVFNTIEPSDVRFRIKAFAFNSTGSTLVLYFPAGIASTPFSLRNKKKTVLIGTTDIATQPKTDFFIGNGIEWEIKKLTKTEFVIEKTYNDLRYRFEFKS